ncbi:MAG: M1 family metallopeptidase [Verrucomicrobia bacterium]|nr:M1 family metallopeptidase [Verrucomicrobiota bacterium]
MRPTTRLSALLSVAALSAGLIVSVSPLHSADTPPSVPDPLRLTRDVEPLAQSVELTLDPAKDDFSGRVRIDLLVHAPTASFRLNSLGPVFTTATLTDLAGRTVSLTAAVTEEKLGLVTLTSPTAIPRGNYTLTISFDNKFNRAGVGIYKTVSRGDPYLFSQFEARDARRAFPCWDEPAFKIPWQLTLTVPAGLAAVANYPVAQESADAVAGTKTLAFGRTPPMPSYLVALAVGPFEFVPVPGLSVPGRIVTPRGQSALAAEAARVSPALLAHLEAYFGVPYPYAKLDQIAVPEYVFGAMENAGFITYVDRLLLMDPVKPAFDARRSLADTAAHEMAHMWFGDLVTLSWWDDLWLNESFADWMCAKIVEQTHPEYRIYLRQVAAIRGAMRTDSLPSVHPIRRPVTARDDPAELIDDITYSKGKGILGMVENWIGPEKFRTAMRAYFPKHRWGNTTAADLWAAFDTASGENVSAMLAAFIEKPGVPFVSFALAPGGRLTLSQKRFANLGDAALPGRWQVPVVVTWSARGRIQHERILLTEESQTVEIPGLADADWVYPNAGEAGYYRWSLPPELNTRLARHAAQLSTLERFGLLDNADALFNAGQLTGGDYLAFLTAFANDPEPEITQKVSGMLGGIRETFVRDAQLKNFNALRSALLRPALTRIGLRPKAGEPAHLAPLRSTLIGVLGGAIADPEVVAYARELTAQFLKDPASIDSSLAASALSVSAFHGDAALYETIVAAFEKPTTPEARSNLIGTLGGFREPALVDRALAYSLTDKLNSTEFLTVAGRVSNNLDLRPRAVDWIIAHFDAIKAKAPAMYLDYTINYAGGGDPVPFKKLSEFLRDPSRITPFAEKNIVKAGEGVGLRTRLREKEQASVDAYLSTFPGTTPTDKK